VPNRNDSSFEFMVRPFVGLRRLVRSHHERAAAWMGTAFALYGDAKVKPAAREFFAGVAAGHHAAGVIGR